MSTIYLVLCLSTFFSSIIGVPAPQMDASNTIVLEGSDTYQAPPNDKNDGFILNSTTLVLVIIVGVVIFLIVGFATYKMMARRRMVSVNGPLYAIGGPQTYSTVDGTTVDKEEYYPLSLPSSAAANGRGFPVTPGTPTTPRTPYSGKDMGKDFHSLLDEPKTAQESAPWHR